MTGQVTFCWIDDCQSPRLRGAQEALLKSIESWGLEPNLFHCGRELSKFGDVLKFARAQSKGDAFVWCNSDVVLLKNPFEITDREDIHGFHRTEIPSGETFFGVDMYLVPHQLWDEEMSRDIPDLYCGASFVDWWLTRAAQKIGRYQSHSGFISHVTHEQSGPSGHSRNHYLKHNQRQYNAWARRYGVGTVDEHVHVPFLGYWQNPSLRDIFQKR